MTVYPAGTAQQLLCLTKIRKQFRDLDEVGFRLWLEGYPVAKRFSRGYLEAAADQSDEFITELEGFRERLESDDEFVGDVAFSELERIAKGNIPRKFPRRLRKRVGSEDFDGAIRIAIDVATGNFVDFGSEDIEIFTRAMLGIKKVDNRILGGALRWLNGSVAPTLHDLSQMLGGRSFREIFSQYSDPQLEEARSEFVELFGGLALFTNVAQDFLGKKLPGFSVVPEVLTNARTIELAWIFLVWCEMRRMPWAEEYPLILTALKDFRAVLSKQKGT